LSSIDWLLGSTSTVLASRDRLRGHFDDDAIVELTASVALQNASSKFNAALGIPSQDFCPALSDDD